MRHAPIIFVVCMFPTFAQAGAWTLPEGTTQIIATTISSNARENFDSNSGATQRVTFDKLFVSAYTEYGWNDWTTIIVDPEFASAKSGTLTQPIERANDFAISGGVRERLWDSFGVFSVEAMARSAGAYELDTSVDRGAGEDFELRALYGTHFELFGRDGCFDAQVAQRWTTGGRPNEAPIDLTLLYDIGWDSQALLQSFNVVSEGRGRPPFDYYRYNKLALSVVKPIGHGFSLQFGGFFTPAGQNALSEHGLFAGLWARF